jgi:hypothetical protein
MVGIETDRDIVHALPINSAPILKSPLHYKSGVFHTGALERERALRADRASNAAHDGSQCNLICA